MKNFFFILIFTLPSIIIAQELQFKNFTAFDGLSTLKTSCVTQGPDGYIWIGTENGLNRFDGTDFRWFSKDINDTNSLPGNVIMSLLIDHNNKLWISTDGGICVFDKEKETFNSTGNERLDTTYCKKIFQDSKNNYWALTGDIITILDENWNIIKILNDQPGDKSYIGNVSFFSIAEDADGIIWLGTQEKGFFSYNPNKGEFTSYSHLTKGQQIFNIFTDSYGNIWISTHNTPYIFIKESQQIYELNDPECPLNMPNVSISYIFENNNSDIITCNWTDGITIYDYRENKYNHYIHSDNNSSSFSQGSTEFGYQDNEGNYWFVGATTGLTVSYANTRKIHRINDPDHSSAGVFHSPVTAITQDYAGNFWFGTDGGGMDIWNVEEGIVREFLHNPEDQNSYGGYSVLAAFTDSRGRVWSGGYNAHLNLYDADKMGFTVFRSDGDPPYQISGSDIRAITEDNIGNIWVATNGSGVNVYDPDSFERKVLTTDDGIAHNYNICILNDNEGNIWIGSYGGLTIYNTLNDSIRVYQKNENDTSRLQSNWINALFKDSKNRYWVGTQLGLALFDPHTGKCKNFLESDGLHNNSIMSIEEDVQGNLWMGTMDGLSRLDTKTWEFTNFNINDGLPDNQFRMGSSFKDINGYLYFGTNKGISYFNPSDISKNPTIPRIRFTGLFINNKLVQPGQTEILEKSIDYTSKLILKKEQNFFRINFVAISYYQADKNTYRYILEGVDDDWIYNNTNYASYTNLKHGRYVFKVQSFNNDGIPSEIREIKIRIKPKWYNTIVFWFIAISGFIYLVYRFTREREEQARRSKETLEKKIKENEQQLSDKIKELETKEEEISKKNLEELEIKYLHEGISKFSDIISQNRENVDELSNHLISELVRYVEANAGIVYVLDDTNEDDQTLKPTGFYCANIDNRIETSFKVGEGNIGTCFVKKEPLILDDLPDGYIELASGLGNMDLRHAILAPILHEDTCLGVIEIASIKKLESYKLEFFYKLSENFASALAITKANEQTKTMLEQNLVQSEELKAQEEEMRQNMEEMKATQEELKRQMEIADKVHVEMEKEKSLIDTMLKNIPENIYFKDKDSKFVKASQSMAKNFKVKNVEEIYGKSDFDFYTEEHARPAFEDEQKIIKTGKPMLDKIEKETHADGSFRWVSTSKMPLYNEKGNIIGTFGISKDITESQTLQEEIKMQNDELQSQEEEMRQNLEEMQTTQEEIKRQMEIAEKAHSELAKEKALIDTLLKYAPENIYFKDKDSKIIKASQSMAENFSVKDVNDIYGKSDFDFFTEEHARPAFEDEQNIIKSGKPIIDKIEKETHNDGTIKYVSTSKMPLYDDKGIIIGTFGISKDITESYKLQENVKIQNEELQSQEEEMRQNLEEMQSIQENLQEQVESNNKLQEKMSEGNALLNTLMNTLPDYIYFKDKKSRFIRISKSMLPLFPEKSLEDMIGKSAFDFQPKEVAQKHFDDEMKIIKTKKGVQDEVAHEVMENGAEQWFSTTKLPLYDEKGKCIGTFGISKNITKLKLQEKEYKKLIDKLREQRKKLSQELKEKENEIKKLKG